MAGVLACSRCSFRICARCSCAGENRRGAHQAKLRSVRQVCRVRCDSSMLVGGNPLWNLRTPVPPSRVRRRRLTGSPFNTWTRGAVTACGINRMIGNCTASVGSQDASCNRHQQQTDILKQ